jgi:hypothetical protein
MTVAHAALVIVQEADAAPAGRGTAYSPIKKSTPLQLPPVRSVHIPPGFPVGEALFRWASQHIRRSFATVELYVFVVGVVDAPVFVALPSSPVVPAGLSTPDHSV